MKKVEIECEECQSLEKTKKESIYKKSIKLLRNFRFYALLCMITGFLMFSCSLIIMIAYQMLSTPDIQYFLDGFQLIFCFAGLIAGALLVYKSLPYVFPSESKHPTKSLANTALGGGIVCLGLFIITIMSLTLEWYLEFAYVAWIVSALALFAIIVMCGLLYACSYLRRIYMPEYVDKRAENEKAISEEYAAMLAEKKAKEENK